MGYQTVHSVEKALAILELLTECARANRPLTLAEISEKNGILPVTARNLLRTLELCGYVRRTGHGKYERGEKFGLLFRSWGTLQQLRRAAELLLPQTVAEIGESLLLAAIVDGKRTELLRCQGPDDRLVDPMWWANEHFYRMHTTRTVLAWFSPEQLEHFLNINGLPKREEWPECRESREGLLAELSRIRGNGGCLVDAAPYCAVAVPVFTANGEIAASLGCYAALSRTDRVRGAGIFALLHECAKELARRAGEAGFGD